MAAKAKPGALTFSKGAVPMKTTDRKYKVRNPTPHDFTSSPELSGKIVAKGSMKVEDEDRQFVVVESGSSLSLVYESKALEELFTASDIGDLCEIVYEGSKDLGGGRQFKRYRVAVWTE